MPRIERQAENKIRELFPQSCNIQISNSIGRNGTPFGFEVDGEKKFIKFVKTQNLSRTLNDIEIRASKQIDSTYVAKLLDCGSTVINQNDYCYLVYKFLDGQTLKDLLDSITQPVDNATLRKIGLSIAKGIRDLWSEGIIHRDIKPQNIIINEQNEATIVDLGIAHFIDYEIRDNSVHGPFYYSSPEQIHFYLGESERLHNTDLAISFSTDLWSLGMILYQLATCQYPFNNQDVTKSIVEDNLVDPKTINPALEENLSEVIKKLLRKFPSERYLSPDLLIDALEQKDVSENTKPIGFYFHLGPSNISKLGYFEEYLKETEIHPEGMIVPARYFPRQRSRIDEIRQLGSKIIIDPETYLFTQGSERLTAPIKSLTYYDRSIVPMTPESCGDDIITDWWIPEIVKYQVDRGADIILPPYFYIDNLELWVRTNHRLIKETIKYCRAKGIDKPVYLPLALGDQIVKSRANRLQILDCLFYLKGLEGIYLLVSDGRQNDKPLTDKDFLGGLIEIVSILEGYGKVILAKADINALFMGNKGLSAFSSNPAASMRRFGYDEDAEIRTGGQPPVEKKFVPDLFSFMKVTDIQAIELEGINLNCNCTFCRNATGRYSSHKHYIQYMAEQSRILTGLSASQKKDHIKAIAAEAKKKYTEILSLPLPNPDISGYHINVWEEVFLNNP